MEQSGLVHGVGHLLPRIDAPLESRRLRDLDGENRPFEGVSKESFVLIPERFRITCPRGLVEVEDNPPGRYPVSVLGDLVAIERRALEVELGELDRLSMRSEAQIAFCTRLS